MTEQSLPSLDLKRQDGVLWVSIDVPPVNLMTAQLMLDLDAVAASAEKDPDLHVIVVQSANPEFFLAHGDLSFVEDPATYAALPVAEETLVGTGPMMRLHERWRRLPQTTIAKVAGLARGGGAELVSSLDLRFAALETAALGQFEALIGIVPGAGATAHLPRLVGRARALEIVLTGGLVDAATAERWGWVNRALPAAELDEYVEWVARAIASLPDGVRAAAIEAIDAADGTLEEALRAENRLLGETFTPASGELARAALAAGVHTREVELSLEKVLRANLVRHP
ncbi:enoyl-CoA hydratase/isomerase family protein [Streptomyces rochei]|uniref:Enoyl-CoA hydratase/isomerase family protein n=1 Tax=Streptomyces rochei TaxID=1928 RepID=A0ABW7E9Y9_STRRO|nr:MULTISPECIES: enoyl-CoA hydratase/isomerase family protein [Streptomyces]GGY60120.1 enoyl-CoA hydratase [Streptomyces geysiriensis]KYK14024.1 enoyl-CoA hydratase [Streptomyces sp. CC71]MBU8548125.1 enoyl-CoA hydratase/isomerase family protein [Streptomyces sp. Osf17]MBU8554896.1 enoyl-CoA hydratase/isomerase family protein [Streptomyces sp. Babs14]RSS73796.1 enoyl-CoA hydratase/isomerase family protein [Streptomyces sp. WAC06128]